MSAADVIERRDDLGRQEQLLQDAIAGGALNGEQRRVQHALLVDTRRELALVKRAEEAIAAGWEPFEPSADWYWGYVEDPRFLRGRTRLGSAILALPLAALAGALLGTHWELLAAAFTAGVLWLGLQACIHEGLGRLAQRRDQARVGHTEGLRMFNAPMPVYAATAYRQARESGLFDTFVVCSPRAEDFRSVSAAQAPSLGLLDPVLVGHIGAFRFLIAQWDLGRDLAGDKSL